MELRTKVQVLDWLFLVCGVPILGSVLLGVFGKVNFAIGASIFVGGIVSFVILFLIYRRVHGAWQEAEVESQLKRIGIFRGRS